MLRNQEKLIVGAGPSSLGHAIPHPSLTLAEARLSLSLLRMCTKRSWAQRIGFSKQLDACAEPGSLKPFFLKSLYLNYACFTANLCLGMRTRQRSVTRPAISKREAGRGGPSSARRANGDPPNVGRGHAHPLVSSDRWKIKGGTWVQPITCREQKRRIKEDPKGG